MAATLSKNDPEPWIPAPHLRLLSKTIVDAVMGKKPRVIINMPPRHGKSFLVSKWTPVWFLENWPTKNVINCGYATEFAETWGRQVRNLATTHAHKLSFQLASDSKARGRWNTTQGGGMIATGVGGQLTGKGGNLLLVDDPTKDHQDANSRLKRDFTWDWWKNTARTRLEPGGAIIILMTRWHEDDLVGRLLKEMAEGIGEHWDILNLPALSGRPREENGIPIFPEQWEVDPEQGPCPLGRKPGDALWPARYSREGLDQLRRGTSEEAWAAQYQGRPANLVGAGNVYKSFSVAGNVAGTFFDPKRPLVWSMDFNVSPMSSVFAQWDEEITPVTYLTNEFRKRINVLKEMVLPNSSTMEMCEEFLNRTAEYLSKLQGATLKVVIYGDRSGNSRKTVGDTDYTTIKQFFRTHREYHVSTKLSTANPAVKDRVNAVNMMLCSAIGERNTTIDPLCKELIKDFREVKWKRDTGGNTTGSIDKSDSERTHTTDAYGYFVEKEFRLRDGDSMTYPGVFR